MSTPRAYVRVTPAAPAEPSALEIATVRFVPANGTPDSFVDLVGAVHIGDRAYYEALNEKFKEYDAVLFELVADEERLADPKKVPNKSALSILGMLQKMATKFLGFEHQIDLIDYQVANMVHADLSPSQLSEAMKNRGATVWSLLLEAIQEAMNSVQSAPDTGKNEALTLLQAFSSGGDIASTIKRTFAKSLASKSVELATMGKTIHGLLIVDRNKAALDVLNKQLLAGKKKIAIFYGAGHNADFEERLVRDFGLVASTETWLTAWDLSSPPAASAPLTLPSE